MKTTRRQLKQIIQEELQQVLNEQTHPDGDPSPAEVWQNAQRARFAREDAAAADAAAGEAEEIGQYAGFDVAGLARDIAVDMATGRPPGVAGSAIGNPPVQHTRYASHMTTRADLERDFYAGGHARAQALAGDPRYAHLLSKKELQHVLGEQTRATTSGRVGQGRRQSSTGTPLRRIAQGAVEAPVRMWQDVRDIWCAGTGLCEPSPVIVPAVDRPDEPDRNPHRNTPRPQIGEDPPDAVYADDAGAMTRWRNAIDYGHTDVIER